jgi:predicted phage terminase large subunit-like protein
MISQIPKLDNQIIFNSIEAIEYNLFGFAKYILNYKKLIKRIHGEWCRLLQNPNKKRILILAPREFFKSTVISISFPIWKLYNNINERILIFSSKALVGKGFIREILSQFSQNNKLRQIWLLKWGYDPYFDPEEWTKSYVTLPRTEPYKEPSIFGAGVLQEPVSWHFDTVILDDVVDIQDQFSLTTREKKKEWFKQVFDFLEENSKLIVVGTRWHKDDLYNMILTDTAYEDWEKIIIKVIDEKGNPTYPEEFNLERIALLKKEKGIHFYSQYMLDPRSPEDSQYFDINQLNYYSRLPELREKVAFLDPALGKKDISSFPALVVIGQGKEDSNIYVLDAFISKVKPAEQIKACIRLYEKWKFTKLGVEANAFQSYLGEDIRKKFRAKRYFDIQIIPVTHTKQKAMRIESIEPLINDGTIAFPDFWSNYVGLKELMNQLKDYPFGALDGLDALEGAISLLSKEPVSSIIESEKSNVLNKPQYWKRRLRK